LLIEAILNNKSKGELYVDDEDHPERGIIWNKFDITDRA